jgi:hypothetical protein
MTISAQAGDDDSRPLQDLLWIRWGSQPTATFAWAWGAQSLALMFQVATAVIFAHICYSTAHLHRGRSMSVLVGRLTRDDGMQ